MYVPIVIGRPISYTEREEADMEKQWEKDVIESFNGVQRDFGVKGSILPGGEGLELGRLCAAYKGDSLSWPYV